LSGPAPEPLPFTIDKPARIAFDLPNTTLAVASRRIDVRSGGVDTVLAAEANGRTRLVVNVDTLMPYSTKVDGNTSSSRSARSPATRSQKQRRCAQAPARPPPPRNARSRRSTFGAAPTAPAA
jgi:type IV pilus assembly protein PilQ